ncbi:hypothetical protein Rsub_01579 [Raphidocelis subcapitata]|uniref:Uncharacterized protein n=1 Tax=Raphidocelis subcapitata TaxID=307507 RepID=A0A2V0NSY1_9CHLO|nr:hypothetical protein Rsub_01579 [Raphidocelis subcapitata]|eukprot:GBF88680.1 hypothetical protein Rsub_01579 [Raphidocelis subcapitata]
MARGAVLRADAPGSGASQPRCPLAAPAARSVRSGGRNGIRSAAALRWQTVDARSGGGDGAAAGDWDAAAAAAAGGEWRNLPLSVLLPGGGEFEVTWLISREDAPDAARPLGVALAPPAAPPAAGPAAAVLPLQAFVEERRRQLQWHRQLQEQLERQFRLRSAPSRVARRPAQPPAPEPPAPPAAPEPEADPAEAARARRKQLNKERYWREEFRGLLPAICGAESVEQLAALLLPLAGELKAAPVSYAFDRLRVLLPRAPLVSGRPPAPAAAGVGGALGAARRGRARGGAGGGSEDTWDEEEDEEEGGVWDAQQQRHGGEAAGQQQQPQAESAEQRLAQALLLALLQRSRQLRGRVQLDALRSAARAAAACQLRHPAALEWLAGEAERQLEAPDAPPGADDAALAIAAACEGLGGSPPLRVALLRRALGDPRGFVARLHGPQVMHAAKLAGTAGEAAPALAAAIVARLRESGGLREASSHTLARLAASVARMCDGGPAPPGWDGGTLAPVVLRALAGGVQGWGGKYRMSHLRIILDSAARCEMRGRADLARRLLSDLAAWAALDHGPPAAALRGGALTRRDRLRTALSGRRGAALLLAARRCGAEPPAALRRWLVLRCVAPALSRCRAWWVRRLAELVAESGEDAGLLLSAALAPWLPGPPAAGCGGAPPRAAGGGAAAAAGGRAQRRVSLHSPSVERLLVAIGHIAFLCKTEADAGAAAGGGAGGGGGRRGGRFAAAEAAEGLATARAFVRLALSDLPCTHAELQRLPPPAAAALVWAATRAGVAPSPGQRAALCAALAYRLNALSTDQLLRLAWGTGPLLAGPADAGGGGEVGGGEGGSGGGGGGGRDQLWAGPPKLCSRLCMELAGRPLSASGLSLALWAVSRLGDAPGARRAFTLLSSRLLRAGGGRLDALPARELVRLATACAQAAWAPPALLAPLAKRGAALAPGLPGVLLAQLLWSLATTQVRHSELLAASADRAEELAAAFEAGERRGQRPQRQQQQQQQQEQQQGQGQAVRDGEGFTSSKQPEALLFAWARLSYRPPGGLAARLRAVADALQSHEARGGASTRGAAGGAGAVAASGDRRPAAADRAGEGAGAAAPAPRPAAAELAHRLAIATARGHADEAYHHTAGRIFPGPGEEGTANFLLQEALERLRLSAAKQQQTQQRQQQTQQQPQPQTQQQQQQQQQQTQQQPQQQLQQEQPQPRQPQHPKHQQQPAGAKAAASGASSGERRERRAALKAKVSELQQSLDRERRACALLAEQQRPARAERGA